MTPAMTSFHATLQELFDHAIALHQAGDLAEANRPQMLCSSCDHRCL